MSNPSDRFAAHLAHLVNDTACFTPGALLVQVQDSLAGAYADSLLGYRAMGNRFTAEEASRAYFERVFERPVLLTGRKPLSVSHELLAAVLGLCPAADGFALAREPGEDAPQVPPALPVIGPFAGLMRVLAERAHAPVSKGSASPTLIQRQGPICLTLAGSRWRVPEELSVWHVLCCLPSPRRGGLTGEAFNVLCRAFIEVMRTVHRHYAEISMLGLNPLDWLDVLPVNQVRSIRAYLRALEACDGNADAAWAQASVTGFASPCAFAESEVGRALRSGGIRVVTVPLENLADSEDEPAAEVVMSLPEFADALGACVEQGRLDAVEATALEQLYEGHSLEEVAAAPAFARWLAQRGLSVVAWAGALAADRAGLLANA